MRSPEVHAARWRAPILQYQQLPTRLQRERRAGAIALLVLLVGIVAFAAAFWWPL